MTEPPVISEAKPRQTILLVWAVAATALALVATFLAVFFVFRWARDARLGASPEMGRDLVAYYPFNGNANDRSGNKRHGHAVDATLTADRFGVPNKAFLFDGKTSHIHIPGTTDLHLDEQGFTLSAWVAGSLTTPRPNDGLIIVGKHCFHTGNGYFLGTDGGDHLRFGMGDSLIAPETYLDDRWHHLVGTFDGATQVLYVDGVLKGSRRHAPPTVNYADIVIGATANPSGFFQGKIDDVRIYSRALTSTEVEALFHNEQ